MSVDRGPLSVRLPPCFSLLQTLPSPTTLTTAHAFRAPRPPSTTYTRSGISKRYNISPVHPASRVDHPRPTLPSFPSLFGDLCLTSPRKCDVSPNMVPKLRVPRVPAADGVNIAELLKIRKETLQNAGPDTTDGGVPSPAADHCRWPGCNFVEPPANMSSWEDHLKGHFVDNHPQLNDTGRCMWDGCNLWAHKAGWVSHFRMHHEKFRFHCPLCNRRYYTSTLAFRKHLDEYHPLPSGGGHGTNERSVMTT